MLIIIPQFSKTSKIRILLSFVWNNSTPLLDYILEKVPTNSFDLLKKGKEHHA